MVEECENEPMSNVAPVPAIPPELFSALLDRVGRVAFVVGAGCSVEAPTGLALASRYALDIHRRLVADGVLVEGECADPSDLSVVASTVWAKCDTQAAVVERLPRREFRVARANDGYLIAAALLRERAVSCVLTLNFDLALSAALTDLSATDVDVVEGPGTMAQFGATAVVYLHRNVGEEDPERWILRREALEEEWREAWEEVVARRVMSSPTVVFAGLGAPAAVLTETIGRIRAVLPQASTAYVVDPAGSTAFSTALALAEEAHIRMGWCDFMRAAGDRVAAEFGAQMEAACTALCNAHEWDDEIDHVRAVCEPYAAIGLVGLGRLRARWLLDQQAYAPDDERRLLLADLLLGLGVVQRGLAAQMVLREDGVVSFVRDGAVVASVLAASGGGTMRWNALEPRIRDMLRNLGYVLPISSVVVGGVQGGRPEEVAAPPDVVGGERGDDITQGTPEPVLVTVDEVRSDPEVITRLVA